MKGAPISVSFDRTVYPLDSILHIRFNLKRIVKNELIKMEIRDHNDELIISKRINPERSRNLSKPPFYIYQTNVKMKGNAWKIGKQYSVIAQYDGFEAIDTMVIAKRKPVLQSDRSVYIIGSDIIVTVIAPDLDKDNEKAETIGNKPGHSLTIESSHGIIENYKLRETGDSTGIFQGLIKLVPVYRIKNSKYVKNKANGTGPLNGRLPVSIAEEIIFKFKSESGTAMLTAYSSNFGVSIELDQKVYCPTDRVYLTIVAPDFNYNSDKIDIIGNKPDCRLSVFTSKGKLTDYRLRETGKDTGIFTGEIVLTSSKDNFPADMKLSSKKFEITKGNGPLNGKLECASSDTLNIELETETDKFMGSAIIKYNIGEIAWYEDHYNFSSTAKIRVIDPDMNLNPNRIDTVNIHVWSDTDLEGFPIKLKETNVATGIFEGEIFIGRNKLLKKKVLKVSEGDTIFAKYVDWSLPPKFKKPKLDLIATAKIGPTKPSQSVKILPNSSVPHEGKYLEPEIITVVPGTKIRWYNEDKAGHTITSGTPEKGPDGNFDSSIFLSGTYFEITLNQTGEFDYFCMLHPWKTGKIIVKGIDIQPIKNVVLKTKH